MNADAVTRSVEAILEYHPDISELGFYDHKGNPMTLRDAVEDYVAIVGFPENGGIAEIAALSDGFHRTCMVRLSGNIPSPAEGFLVARTGEEPRLPEYRKRTKESHYAQALSHMGCLFSTRQLAQEISRRNCMGQTSNEVCRRLSIDRRVEMLSRDHDITVWRRRDTVPPSYSMAQEVSAWM